MSSGGIESGDHSALVWVLEDREKLGNLKNYAKSQGNS